MLLILYLLLVLSFITVIVTCHKLIILFSATTIKKLNILSKKNLNKQLSVEKYNNYLQKNKKSVCSLFSKEKLSLETM